MELKLWLASLRLPESCVQDVLDNADHLDDIVEAASADIEDVSAQWEANVKTAFEGAVVALRTRARRPSSNGDVVAPAPRGQEERRFMEGGTRRAGCGASVREDHRVGRGGRQDAVPMNEGAALATNTKRPGKRRRGEPQAALSDHHEREEDCRVAVVVQGRESKERRERERDGPAGRKEREQLECEMTIRHLRAQLDEARAHAAHLEAELSSTKSALDESRVAVERAVAEERRQAVLDAEVLRTTLERRLRDCAQRAQATKAEVEKARKADKVALDAEVREAVAAARARFRAELEQCRAELEQRHAAVLVSSVTRIDSLLRERDELVVAKAAAINERDEAWTFGAAELNKVAMVLKAQGKYDEARELYEWSLKSREQALGPDHPDVATSLNSLAILLDEQVRCYELPADRDIIALGKYDQAMPLYERSLQIREKALGPDHPDVAESLNNLAVLWTAQGKYDEAMPLYERSLQIREKALGPDHPNVAESLNNPAVLLSVKGKLADALKYSERALAICEQQVGSGHPNAEIVRRVYLSCKKKCAK